MYSARCRVPDERAAMAHRRIKVLLNPQTLHGLLSVPEDVQIDYVYGLSDPQGVAVVLSSDRFEEVPDNAETPITAVHWSQVLLHQDGKTYIRVEWDGQQAEQVAA
jgi:hypothetical protein